MRLQSDQAKQEDARKKSKTDTLRLKNTSLQSQLQLLGTFFLVLNTWGLVNSFGVFQTYYETALLSHFSPSSISWIGTVQTFLVEIVGVIAGPMFDHGHIFIMIPVGSFLVVFGTMMLSLATEYWQIFLAQALCVGIGSGILFVPSVAIASSACSTKWRPLAIGFMSSGSSIGGVIFPILFSSLEPRIGFPWTVRVIGFVALGTFIPSFVALYSAKGDDTNPKTRSWVDTSAFREPAFMVYVIALFLIYSGYWVPYFYLSSFASTVLHTSPELALYLISIMNAAGVFGRLLPGILTAKRGAMETFIGATACAGTLSLAWIGIHTLPGLIVFSVLYGLLSGSLLTLTAVMLVSLSAASPDMTGTRLGMGYTGVGIGILIGSPVAAAIADTTRGDFIGAQAWCGGTLLGGAALAVYPWLYIRRARN